jgi:hypothetical protein
MAPLNVGGRDLPMIVGLLVVNAIADFKFAGHRIEHAANCSSETLMLHAQ